MSDTVDNTETPFLQELLNYLPIEPTDEEDILNYIKNITRLININYKYDQYQFAYFGIHLLYMTYIYCTVWKISQIEPDRYKDAIIFARAYSGREKDLKIEDTNSVFVYSLMPEKDIAKLFKVINLDKSQISFVSDLVDARNEMTHASGKLEVLTEDIFYAKASNVINSMKNIHRCMDAPVRKWYGQVLIDFCEGKYEGYDNPSDVIFEQMIQSFKLSVNELLVCNEMSIRYLIAEHRNYQKKLNLFKKTMKKYCKEKGYVRVDE